MRPALSSASRRPSTGPLQRTAQSSTSPPVSASLSPGVRTTGRRRSSKRPMSRCTSRSDEVDRDRRSARLQEAEYFASLVGETETGLEVDVGATRGTAPGTAGQVLLGPRRFGWWDLPGSGPAGVPQAGVGGCPLHSGAGQRGSVLGLEAAPPNMADARHGGVGEALRAGTATR